MTRCCAAAPTSIFKTSTPTPFPPNHLVKSNRVTLVQKFGGAALADGAAMAAAAQCVVAQREAGHQVCVVVSAMGETTDDLLLTAGRLGVRADDRECDALLACAENQSAALFAMQLRRHGISAMSLSGGQAGIRTDAEHGNANVGTVDPQRLLSLLARDIVPVVAGFQGVTDEGDTTTLGRGGSDLSAVLLGAALEAEAVELYKDVAGVYDKDPNLHSDAKVVRQVTVTKLHRQEALIEIVVCISGKRQASVRSTDVRKMCERVPVLRSHLR